VQDRSSNYPDQVRTEQERVRGETPGALTVACQEEAASETEQGNKRPRMGLRRG